MLLHGIVIADPASKNIRHDIQELRIEEEKREVQNDNLPAISQGDQAINRRFPKVFHSVLGFDTEKFDTIPNTTANNNAVGDFNYQQEVSKKADVEIFTTEADKWLVDQGMNKGAYYDPKGMFPIPTFKRTIRPNLRTIRSPASRMATAKDYTRENHYLYKSNGPSLGRSFRPIFYTNSPWRDPLNGRVNLFEKPREASIIA